MEELNTPSWRELFVKVSEKDGKDFREHKNLLGLEWGLKKFREKTFGIIGRKKELSLEELAVIFNELGMTETIEEAKHYLSELGNFEGVDKSSYYISIENRDNKYHITYCAFD
jgi:hypothetical protein